MTAKRFISLFALIAVVIAIFLLFREDLNPESLRVHVTNLGVFGPVIFIFIYALATVSFIPGSILTLSGGLLFGPYYGTLYNLIGATLGATGAFLMARYIAHDWIAKKSGKKLQPLLNGIKEEGWRFVAFVRLVPLIPFNLLNYALGLTEIRLSQYVIASSIFMLPGCIAYTYLGHVGAEAASGKEGLIQKGLLALAILAAVAFLPRIIKRIRGKADKSAP